ncbi:MAG: glycerophosphodiester phosphodiesterase family protein [Candidatus Hydrogenedentes bacterium]|nr:glycerophosphodiester phosphodiesterase family protein [Candidatus Hydrogenedentota bacterium]
MNRKNVAWALPLSMLLAVLTMLSSVAAAAPESVLPPPKNGHVYVVAHRGAHQGIPENTLPAYQKAIDLGADFVEIDVRTTKDGKFVSVHNGKVDDYTQGAVKGNVSDMTLEELRALDIGSRVGPEWKDTKIPTFEEILDLCKGKIGIYLDLKAAEVAPLIKEIKARGMERSVIWYAGPSKLKEVVKLCPECIPMPDPYEMKNLPKLLEQDKPRLVASSWDFYSKEFAEKCHAAGALVIVDDDGPQCWGPALDWGTDGIQTDEPEQLIAYIKQRESAKSTK